ncbi:MAG: hypothetical protein ABSA69_08825, partial [Verrucomicrobiota bacterium]
MMVTSAGGSRWRQPALKRQKAEGRRQRQIENLPPTRTFCILHSTFCLPSWALVGQFIGDEGYGTAGGVLVGVIVGRRRLRPVVVAGAGVASGA